jgi:uncharacterized protein (TIGR02444 family)
VSLEIENPLWLFSLAIYSAPDVSTECIDLQDKAGVDVNVLLFAAWLGATRGLLLTSEHFKEIEAVSGEWQLHVLTPFRAIRRRIGTMPNIDRSLYEKVKLTELMLEKEAQSKLYTLAGRLHGQTTQRPDAIRSNVSLCIRQATANSLPDALIRTAVALACADE